MRKTEILREMYMEMVETVIAEGRWKYRVDVPCAYSRRRPNSVRLYFSDYVSRIFFLVRCADATGAEGIGAPLVLAAQSTYFTVRGQSYFSRFPKY